MYRSLILAFALLAAASVSHAAEPSARAMELSRKIVTLQLEDAKPQLEEINKSIRVKIASEEDPEKREILTQMFGETLFDEEDLKLMNDGISKSVASKLTESELQQTLTFLQSSAGRKFAKLDQDIKKDMMPVVIQIIGRKMSAAGATMKKD